MTISVGGEPTEYADRIPKSDEYKAVAFVILHTDCVRAAPSDNLVHCSPSTRLFGPLVSRAFELAILLLSPHFTFLHLEPLDGTL